MEFSIDLFTQRLRDLMYNSFPYENNEINQKKHSTRIGHIRDVAFKNNETIRLGDDQLTFDIGNVYAEERYPYYHILEDAPYIRKRDRATTKTRGSQEKVEYLGARNYNNISWNGKTYTKEYAKNVRGKRSRLSKVSHWATDYNGNRVMVNRESNSYQNVHYHYIENMLSLHTQTLAIDFGLKLKRVQDSGLGDDYEMSKIIDIFNSFEEE